MVAVAAIAFLAYVLLAVRRPPTYLAASTMVIKDFGLRDRVLRFLTQVGPYTPSLDTQTQMIQSKSMAQTVADTLPGYVLLYQGKLTRAQLQEAIEAYRSFKGSFGDFLLKNDYVSLAELERLKAEGLLPGPGEIRGLVTVSAEQRTGVITLEARARTPFLAALIARRYAEESVRQNRQMAQDQFSSAVAFLEKQREIYEDRLTLAEERLRQFNQRHGVVDFNQALQSAYDKLRTYEDEMERIAIESQAMEGLAPFIERRASTQPLYFEGKQVVPNPRREQLERELFSLQIQLEQLKTQYTESHPKVHNVKLRINRLQQELDTKVAPFVELPAVQENRRATFLQERVESDFIQRQFLNAKQVALQAIKNRRQEKLKTLSEKQFEYATLLREAKTSERILNNIQDMLDQMRVSEVTQPGNLDALDLPAVSPPEAQRTDLTSIETYLLSLIISLLAGVMVGVVLELLDDRVRSAHHVRRYLNLPVLGTIPKIKEEKDRLLHKIELKSPVAEAYHKVCFQLESASLDRKAKALLLTSVRSEEGKTTMVSNIGISLAREGERVLLIDGDIRRPALHRIFGLSNTVGLTSLLRGDLGQDISAAVDTCIQPTTLDRLSIITCGPLVTNPVEMLRSEQMAGIVRCARERADIVIFDSSPLAAVIDPVIIGSYLDGVILLIDTSRIHRKEALQAKTFLSNLKLPILGVILNNMQVEDEDYYYYYYYSGYGQRVKRSGRAK